MPTGATQEDSCGGKEGRSASGDSKDAGKSGGGQLCRSFKVIGWGIQIFVVECRRQDISSATAVLQPLESAVSTCACSALLTNVGGVPSTRRGKRVRSCG